MNYNDALTKIIDIGIEAAKRDYARQVQVQKRNGSLQGFGECCGLSVEGLAALLGNADARADIARRDQAADYWYWRCRQAEIEWVCNVISAMLMNEGLPVIIQPTARGLLMADRILRLEAM